jgi:hypothetical protein
MNVLLAQIILIAQGEDVGKWTNILFVIVLAMFWVVGSIVKARTKKPEGEEEKKEGQWSRKPGGKLREVAERIERELSQLSRDRVSEPPERAAGPQREPSRQAGQARPGGPAPRTRYGPQAPRRPRPAGRPQAPARKPSARPKPTPASAFGLPEEPGVSPEMPEVPTGVEQLPEYIREHVEGLEDKYAHISADKPAAESPLQSLLDLDYADPYELRRAILHYEILGRPLAMRGPGEQLI